MTKNYIETLPDGTSFPMIFVEGGTYGMGKRQEHEVTVPDFYIGQFLVTQAVWEAIMGENPSRFKGKNHPVERVSWGTITEGFLPKLNAMTGKNYRLPSEAEWEYAARGGKHESPYRYSGSNNLKEVGWYHLNSHSETKPVGQKLPNALGLFDMSGNVDEWCADEWQEDLAKIPRDGSPAKGQAETSVIRGGSWDLIEFDCTVWDRDWYNTYIWVNTVGFRVCRY